MSATRNLSTLADLPRGTNFVLKNGFFSLIWATFKKRDTSRSLSPSRFKENSGQFYSLKLNHSSVHCPHFDGTSITYGFLQRLKNVEDTVDLLSSPLNKKGGKFPTKSTKDHVSLKKKA